jgi:hypothetical protein
MLNPAGYPTVWLNSSGGEDDSWHLRLNGFWPNLPGFSIRGVFETTPADPESV